MTHLLIVDCTLYSCIKSLTLFWTIKILKSARVLIVLLWLLYVFLPTLAQFILGWSPEWVIMRQKHKCRLKCGSKMDREQGRRQWTWIRVWVCVGGSEPSWTAEGVRERNKGSATEKEGGWLLWNIAQNEWLAVLNQCWKSYYSHKYYLC